MVCFVPLHLVAVGVTVVMRQLEVRDYVKEVEKVGGSKLEDGDNGGSRTQDVRGCWVELGKGSCHPEEQFVIGQLVLHALQPLSLGIMGFILKMKKV